MSRVPNFPGKKISLYDKRIKMLPEISLFAVKKPTIKSGVNFWPEDKEKADDGLPATK
jgi:hypothetical protein